MFVVGQANAWDVADCMKRERILLAVVSMVGQTAFAGGVIPADRQTDWYQAGVPGGIPAVTTIYATFTSAATAAQINTALNNCPSNSVVLLNAGIYDLGGSEITLKRDGVVLRGATSAAGFPLTILNNTEIQMARSQWPALENWSNVKPIDIASGLTEGSTSMTLASSPNSDFKVGDVFMIDQADDGINVKTSSVTWAHRPSRAYCLIAQCTRITGNTIGFQPPLLGEYWNLSRRPQAFGWSSLYGPTLKRAGLESLDVVPNGSLYNISMGPAWACWATNIRTTGWPKGGGSAGFRMTYSACCSLFWSIFHDGGQVSNSSYAVYPVVVTGCAVEGNIFTNLALAMPCISAVGCSFSYNYATGPYPYSPSSWLAEYFFPHGGHTHDTLYEGNWLEGSIYLDAIFGGNNSRVAIVHNRIKGWASGKTGNTSPIVLESDTDNTVIMGNVLGEKSYHTRYSEMFKVDDSCEGTDIRNNYNTVDDGVDSDEALAGDDTVASSYRYAVKPAWFGSLPWPSFSLSADSTTELAYTNLPAGFRNYFGADSPDASFLRRPNPPQNLRVSGP